jgi:diaminobutyrate-2-oxoglutarate transaminase
MDTFFELESEVRSYIRSFPVVFDKGIGSTMVDENKKEYIDFFSGAGTLNYGHNPPVATQAMIQYLQNSGVVHGLDKATVAKRSFIQSFQELILEPRQLAYKFQFTGPTGTNATETAMKLARKVKKRSNIVAFTNAYHGHTMGALAVTGNAAYQDDFYDNRGSVHHMPFDTFGSEEFDSMELFRSYLSNKGSGLDLPAAVIVETIQGEGGINIATVQWLQKLQEICREYDILLIIDDIQMGNGRTGTFFSFEEAGIKPDMVCLSKSIGGGLPMALLLFKPELDAWTPGEHTGTFRGNNLAFVAATALIQKYWSDSAFSEEVLRKGRYMAQRLGEIQAKYPKLPIRYRGKGMVWGIEIEGNADFASELSKACFNHYLIAETCGVDGQVLKLFPALTIDDDYLIKGLDLFAQSFDEALEGVRS